jgi:class 3 adenylate cyclase
MFKYAAAWNAPAAFLEFMLERGPFAPRAGTPLDRILKTKDAIHRADASVDEVLTDSVRLAGARSHLTVPMFKDEAIAGAIIIYRQEVRPFSEKQLALVQNFAAQAVIAIENARLLNELRQRTTDLSESLEQQTASSEVLRVISSAPGELNAVFEAILSNATRICEATYGNLLLRENGAFRRAAQCNAPQELIDEFQKNPVFVPLPNNPLDRLLKTKDTVHTVDAQADSNLGVLADARTLLNVPMLSHDELIGAISIYRQEVRPFSDKQIALLLNFAAQAVIAIDNARLLNELRDRTQEVVKLNQQLEQRVADQVGEIERMGRLRRFLPPQVADLIVASGAEKQLESHRREITALFCDLRGFTGFSESSDPEDVMALLAEYHGAIGKIIIKYSGTLERYAGDGVMVIFSDPVPVENPALQAVLMALDMRAAIGELIERWRDLGHDLGFGIGIAHGFATLGTIGFEGRRDYAAIGTVSNIASRLCDEAKPGQILISPRVRQAVEKAVTIEQIGEFSLKGIRRPMLAYNVLAASASKSNSESN